MAGFLQHIAINTTHFEESVGFFESLFEMKVERIAGEKPKRQLWYREKYSHFIIK